MDQCIDTYLKTEPSALIVMTAAVNDYEVHTVHAAFAGGEQEYKPGEKIPSGADELSVILRPASKLIDSLSARGHKGPLVACKYEAAETVLDAARSLRERVNADVVLANSLCASVQALVDEKTTTSFSSRDAVLSALLQRIDQLL